MEVMRNQEFLMLSGNEVAKLFESDDLNVPSEETIFHVNNLFICIYKLYKSNYIKVINLN